MMDVLAHEPAIRLSAFLGVLLVVAACEAWAPRRERAVSRRARWPHNLGIGAVNTLVVRGVLPLTTVGLAVLAENRAGPSGADGEATIAGARFIVRLPAP